ncbi:hypothetical protein IJT93_03755 [bacterium]|nr:hypothetical protein [bacterium]
MDLNAFTAQYGVCIILCGIGLFFVIVSYCAIRAGRSGVPGVGGLFILIGFLLSPVKWLAFLCLTDYGIWYLPYLLISDPIIHKKAAEKFRAAAAGAEEAVRDESRMLIVRVDELNEELKHHYITNFPYRMHYPAIHFFITENDGDRKLLLLESLKSDVKIIDFNKNKLELGSFKKKGKNYTVEIEAAPFEI